MQQAAAGKREREERERRKSERAAVRRRGRSKGRSPVHHRRCQQHPRTNRAAANRRRRWRAGPLGDRLSRPNALGRLSRCRARGVRVRLRRRRLGCRRGRSRVWCRGRGLRSRGRSRLRLVGVRGRLGGGEAGASRHDRGSDDRTHGDTHAGDPDHTTSSRRPPPVTLPQVPNDLGFHELPPSSSLLLVQNATRPHRTRQSPSRWRPPAAPGGAALHGRRSLSGVYLLETITTFRVGFPPGASTDRSTCGSRTRRARRSSPSG